MLRGLESSTALGGGRDCCLDNCFPGNHTAAVSSSPNPISPLEAHLGYWLRFVSNYVSTSFARRLAEHKVTVAEWVALRCLYARCPCSLSALVDEIGMNKGAVSRLVDRLHRRGWVRREVAPSDRRTITLTLTPTGRRLLPRLAQEADDNDAAFFGHLSAHDRQELRRMLQALVERHQLASKPID